MVKVEIGTYSFSNNYIENKKEYIMDTSKEVIFEALKNNFPDSIYTLHYNNKDIEKQWESIGTLFINDTFIHVEEVSSIRLDKFLDIIPEE